MPVPRLLVIAALAIAALAAAPTAEAARSVPHGFYGVMWDNGVTRATPESQDATWDLMAESGVESVRTVFEWAEAQPVRNGPVSFAKTDEVVRRAAMRRISLLPVVEYAPAWAKAYPRRFTSPPRDNGPYVAYLAALIRRYGPQGSFWTDNPTVPKRPLREWQIWNEPHLQAYWAAPENGRYGYLRAYPRLLRASYRTIKQVDPGAKVVLAGLTQRAWDELELLYSKGRIKGLFDVAALQIFPQTVRRAAEASRLFRAVMRARGDRRKPIYLTELTWPASKGKVRKIKYLSQETPRGMAIKLEQAYRTLIKQRHSLGLGRVYWYTWASPYRGRSTFDYAGLLRFNGDVFRAQPALGAYQRSARRYQGCAKSKTGDCL